MKVSNAVIFAPLVFVLELPWTIYTGYVREHQYDLATQSFGPWFSEALIGLAVSMVIGPLLLVALLSATERERTTQRQLRHAGEPPHAGAAAHVTSPSGRPPDTVAATSASCSSRST